MIKQLISFLPWTLKASIEIEIPDDTKECFRLRAALEIAVKQNKNLDGASLDGARLDGARLDGASLVRASLVRASLDGASLDGARLDGASLDGASLDGARLDGASLDGASLDGARLDGASLDGASLDGASLARASLDGASLRSIRADVFDVLLRGIPELPGLLSALREGRINGSVYKGDCACLVGTIANVRSVDIDDEQFNFRDSTRPAECWFYGIKKGDTPETSQISKITEGWIVEFMALVSPNQTPKSPT